ncbi:MAG: glycosyltransferase family 4 protein [Fimbriimonas sp.]
MIRRVLMTADTVGGVWDYSLDLSRQLGGRGIEIALATMGRALTPDQAREAKAIANLEVFESEYKLEWMEDPWGDVRSAGRWLLALEDAFLPDAIHLNGYCHAALPWSAPTLVVCHSCVLSWWKAVKGECAPTEWARYEEEVRRGLQAADTVVAPTAAMLAEAAQLYGPFRDSQVIPNTRRVDAFRPAEKEPVVFSAGRFWDEAKNVRALDAIAPKLPWPVFVAGEGETVNATALGRLSSGEVSAWLGKASIYALPARYEPFGLSVLEAALSGCALVLGDIPSLRENWSDCALFVAPDDHEALRRAVQSLIDDPKGRKRLADQALRRAQAFDPRCQADAYVTAYERLDSQRFETLSVSSFLSSTIGPRTHYAL